MSKKSNYIFYLVLSLVLIGFFIYYIGFYLPAINGGQKKDPVSMDPYTNEDALRGLYDYFDYTLVDFHVDQVNSKNRDLVSLEADGQEVLIKASLGEIYTDFKLATIENVEILEPKGINEKFIDQYSDPFFELGEFRDKVGAIIEENSI